MVELLRQAERAWPPASRKSGRWLGLGGSDDWADDYVACPDLVGVGGAAVDGKEFALRFRRTAELDPDGSNDWASSGGNVGGSMAAQDQLPVRVLVVDDSEVFRNVLAALVAATPGFDVVGRASSGREALSLIPVLDVEFVLLDPQVPDLDGIETALRIRRHYPDVVVLLLTAFRQASLSDPSLTVEDKRDLSAEWLADFWHRHSPRR